MSFPSSSLKEHNKSFKRILSMASILIFLAFLLLFPTSSLKGAKTGLLLWFNTLLPTLLPFIIVSNLIVKLKITKPLSKILYPIFHKLFGVSLSGCYPLLMGMLSGMPVGAKSIGDMVREGSLSRKEGQYLLGFCNNASPMFVMGFIAISQLNLPSIRVPLLIILYSSGVISSLLWYHLLSPFSKSLVKTQDLFVNNREEEDSSKFDFAKLDASIMDGFDVITRVGGYVILFSIVAQIISDINGISALLQSLLIGFLEITTGINKFSTLSLPIELKIAFITGITAFGGLSGMAQTNSVITHTSLSIFTYFKVKLLHMSIAFGLIYGFLLLFPVA
ncbi:MAG: hypothetical protein ACK5JH_10100 [Anaerocolumna sp.]